MNRVDHLWTVAIEEASEIQHVICKIQRFGGDDGEGDYGCTNIEHLSKEWSQLNAAIEMLQAEGFDIRLDPHQKAKKKAAVEHWLEYSAKRGRLDNV